MIYIHTLIFYIHSIGFAFLAETLILNFSLWNRIQLCSQFYFWSWIWFNVVFTFLFIIPVGPHQCSVTAYYVYIIYFYDMYIVFHWPTLLNKFNKIKINKKCSAHSQIWLPPNSLDQEIAWNLCIIFRPIFRFQILYLI